MFPEPDRFDLFRGDIKNVGFGTGLGLVGVPPRPESEGRYNIAGLITYGHTIKGVIEGDSDPDVFIPELLALHAEGRFPFDKLVRTYPFSAINEALGAQHRGECVKVVLLTGGEGASGGAER